MVINLFLSIGRFVVASLFAVSGSAWAETAQRTEEVEHRRTGKEMPPYLQGVPYARKISGVQIYGDTHTWWD